MYTDTTLPCLFPGVVYRDDHRFCSKVFLVWTQFQTCFSAARMEKVVMKLLIPVNQGIKFVRECKHHMEVRGVNDFRPAFINPDLFQDSLTAGTVPVTAGTIVEFHVPAFAALADIDSKPAGLAGEDCAGSFPLFF